MSTIKLKRHFDYFTLKVRTLIFLIHLLYMFRARQINRGELSTTLLRSTWEQFDIFSAIEVEARYQARSMQSGRYTWGVAALHVSDITSTAAANRERYHVLYLGPALHALLHQGRAALAGTHVSARMEQHARLAIRTHHTFFNLRTNVHYYAKAWTERA